MAFDYWQELLEKGVYHIYNKSVTGEKMFRDSDDYNRFTSKYERYFGSYFDTFANSLIPNHFHFLIRVKPLNKTVLDLIAKEDTRSAQEIGIKSKITQPISF